MVTMRPHSGLDHVGHDGLEAVEGAREVDRHHALPGLDADVEEVHEALDAGAGHQDPDRAEGGAHLVQRSVDGGPVAHVDRDANGTPTVSLNLLGHLLGRVAVDVEHGDPWPLAASWWQMARPMPEPPP